MPPEKKKADEEEPTCWTRNHKLSQDVPVTVDEDEVKDDE